MMRPEDDLRCGVHHKWIVWLVIIKQAGYHCVSTHVGDMHVTLGALMQKESSFASARVQDFEKKARAPNSLPATCF